MQNLKRIYSLGHEGSKPQIIRSILSENIITRLIDIRPKNQVKMGSFSILRLQDLLQEVNVSYFHQPDLAPSTVLLREANQRKRAIGEQFQGRDKETRLKKSKALQDYVEQEFKRRYLTELDQKKSCEIFLNLINQAERCCFFSKNNFDHLAVSNRKILIDHCLLNCGLKAKLIHLREWFHHSGQCHDLRKAFERVNKIHFDNKLKRSEVAFSWYHGLSGGLKRFTFGQFRAPNLILINQKMDLPVVPEFMINAILHHELIHYTRYRDGRDHRHTVDFYIDELGFEEAGKAFFWKKDFWEKNFPKIQEEIELAKIKIEATDPSIKPLLDYIDHIMTGKIEKNESNTN